MLKPLLNIILFIYLFTHSNPARAQLLFQPTIGTSFWYVSEKNIPVSYTPVIKPNASILVHIPISNKVRLQTGVGLVQVAYSSVNMEATSSSSSTKYALQTNINYLSIPLMVSYRAYKDKKAQYWIDAGLNYNFFMSGVTHYALTNYIEQTINSTSTFNQTLSAPLIPQDNDPNTNKYHLTGLDITFRLQAHAIINKHYNIAVYWDNGLYSILASPANSSSLVLHDIGISLGYLFF